MHVQQDVYAITDVETLKVFSDPFRLRLLQLMTDEPCTVKQLAMELAVRPTKLYYHINLLEQRGLVRVVETRLVGHIAEKLYQSVARRFSVERANVAITQPLSPEDVAQGLDAVVELFLHNTSHAIREGVRSGMVDPHKPAPDPNAMLLKSGRVRLSATQAMLLFQRFQALVQEIQQVEADVSDQGQWYAFSLTLNPTPPDDQQTPPSSNE
jgi:DNA-binding transcriptional ArsR family regulator